jgi:hypothetical protein
MLPGITALFARESRAALRSLATQHPTTLHAPKVLTSIMELFALFAQAFTLSGVDALWMAQLPLPASADFILAQAHAWTAPQLLMDG